MHRIVAVAIAFVAVACGGGGGDSATPTPRATDTPTQQVAGARNEPTSTATASPTANPGTYTVVEGDTLSEIAARFNLTVAELVDANHLADPDALTVGQQLTLRAPAAGTTPLPSATAQ